MTMKRQYRWCAQLAFLLLSASLYAHAGTVADAAQDHAALLRNEDQFAAAAADGDVAYLERTLVSDYVGIESSGTVVHKPDVLADARQLKKDPATAAANHFKNEQLTVRFYGDTAIVTGTVVEQFGSGHGPTSTSILFTDVWVRRNGNWMVASTQGTRTSPVSSKTQ